MGLTSCSLRCARKYCACEDASKSGSIISAECDTLVAELERILKEDIETGQFVINDGVEDIHSQIEFMSTEKLGRWKKIIVGQEMTKY